MNIHEAVFKLYIRE